MPWFDRHRRYRDRLSAYLDGELTPSESRAVTAHLADCALCRDERRDPATICVIEDVADLWAIEHTGAYKGRYHVLGGTLSALDGRGPDELGLARLIARVTEQRITEVILATSATVEGQTTAHYIAERLAPSGAAITRLAHGVPLGGEINYLDDGTLAAALKARRPAS